MFKLELTEKEAYLLVARALNVLKRGGKEGPEEHSLYLKVTKLADEIIQVRIKRGNLQDALTQNE